MLLLSSSSPSPHKTTFIWLASYLVIPFIRHSSRYHHLRRNPANIPRSTMKKLARFALIITLLVGCLPSTHSSAAPTLPNNEGWLYGAAGYDRAVELQQKLNVPLVVYFYADWCPYCRTLDSQYLPSAPVQDYLGRVVKVRINPEQGLAERALAKRFGVAGYPSFFVMRDSAARPVNVQPFRKVSNMTPTQFANACRAIAPVSRTAPAVKNSGASGKFSERQADLVAKETTTSGGTKILTVVPVATAAPRARSRKAQP
jgi:thiol-disulfide isomerase/thioredoxin